jgi:hypothetical protein
MTVSSNSRRRSTRNLPSTAQPLVSTRTLLLVVLAAAAGAVAVLFPDWGQGVAAGFTALLALHSLTGK